MTSLKLYTKKRRKRIGPEACLQITVIEHLRLLARPGVVYFSIPNEGKRSPAAGVHLKRMGMLPGIADLCIIIQDSCGWNEPHFLELKAQGEKQSLDQRAFQDLCVYLGISYACCDNITAALAQLETWGALRSSSRRAA